MFELDGNTAQDATPPPYDWEGLFNADGSQKVTPGTDGLLASGFVADSALPDHSYFAQSDKDTHDITTWKCKTVHKPTPKDDLLNAYAAVIHVPGDASDNAGHKVLYLGSERRSNLGDAFAGFWLLKDPSVGCNTASGTAAFSGRHTVGDILVVSDYTNGGTKHAVKVYEWMPGAPRNLKLLIDGNICGATPATDEACGIANSDTIQPPWDSQKLKKHEFVEAGVDLTALLEQAGGTCFSTFLAETRTSQQKTAELKDFAGGQFNTCPPAPITTTATPGGDAVLPGTPQHDVATLGTADDLPIPTGTVTFFLCGPDEVTAAGCTTGGSAVGSAVTLDNGSATSDDVTGSTTPNDNTPGKYCWRAEYTPDAKSQAVYTASSETNGDVGGPGAECFVVQVPPSSSSSASSSGSSSAPTSHSVSATSATHSSSAPTSHGVAATSVGPVASTGAGPLRDEIAWAVGLLVLGGAAVLAGRRRGYHRLH